MVLYHVRFILLVKGGNIKMFRCNGTKLKSSGGWIHSEETIHQLFSHFIPAISSKWWNTDSWEHTFVLQMTEAAKCRNALWGMESSGPHQRWLASRYDNSHSVTQGGRVLVSRTSPPTGWSGSSSTRTVLQHYDYAAHGPWLTVGNEHRSTDKISLYKRPIEFKL